MGQKNADRGAFRTMASAKTPTTAIEAEPSSAKICQSARSRMAWASFLNRSRDPSSIEPGICAPVIRQRQSVCAGTLIGTIAFIGCRFLSFQRFKAWRSGADMP
jgi:hypothetical protein